MDDLVSLNKNNRTAEERNARMLALTAEDQATKVTWMRHSELTESSSTAGRVLSQGYMRGE